MRVSTRTGIFCVLISTLAAASLLPGEKAPVADPAADPAAGPEKAAGKPRLRVTISKQTTHILGPLDDHGYVDYIAALNQQYGRGVTPENNAAVLLWQVLGPADMNQRVRQRFFGLLGVPVPPEKGPYFVDLSDYQERFSEKRRLEGDQSAQEAEQPQRLWDAVDEAMYRPWSKKELPELAEWIAFNQKPLQTVVQATRRPRFYAPLVATGDPPMVIAVLLPTLQGCRVVCRGLATRAMLRLGAGEVDAAREDLLACHRLARLVGQGPTVIDGLVCIAIDRMACRGDAAVAHHGKLTADQARQYAAELRKLPPLPKMADAVDCAERFMYLDGVTWMARRGPTMLESFTDGHTRKSRLKAVVDRLLGSLIDWDEVLRLGNSWYDRTVAALRKTDPAQRRKALDELDQEVKKMSARITDPASLAKSLLLSGQWPRTAAGRLMGQVMVALLLPAIQAVAVAEDRSATRVQLTELSLALAGYRSDHGGYPDRLARLVPKYIDKVPKDVFSNAGLHYRPQGKDYLLWSVGPDGEDNGGHDHDSDPAHDDIVVRTRRRAE